MPSVWIFFGLALGGTWLLQLPALLGARGVLPGGVAPYVALAALGGLGPLVAAVVAARSEGPGRVRSLFATLRPRAGLVAWYVVFGWLFDRTRGSLLAAVVAHAGVHLDNPTHALPG